MKLSSLTEKFGTGIFAYLSAKKEELESQGKKVIDLFVGTPDFPCEKHILDAAKNSLCDPNNIKYSLLDSPEMINAVIKYYKKRYNVAINKDMIASCNGTQDGMGHIGMILAERGNYALVPNPGYIAFETSVTFSGATPYRYPLLEENGFIPDFDEIPKEVLKNTAYAVMSYPSNPVGAVAPKSTYQRLIALAKEYDFAIINDNAYSDIIYEGEGFSFLSIEGAKEVGAEFFSLSKSFNTTGARISFLIGNEKLVSAFRKLRSQYDFGMFLPIQQMAIAALSGEQSGVKARCAEYKKRRDAFCGGLRSIGWQVKNPSGTMFVFAPVPKGHGSSKQFAEELIEKSGVMCTPGAEFGSLGDGFVRFALVKPVETLLEAVERIRESGIFEK